MKLGKDRLSWFGIALIVFGTALLLSKFHVLRVEFSQLLWLLVIAIGMVKVLSGFSRKSGGGVFWGTVIFLFGLFFFLGSFDSIEIHTHMFPSSAFLIFGIAFLMAFLNNIREWHILIPAVLLIALGGAFTLAEFGYLSRWEVWEAIRLYWPIALILVGLGMIMRRRMRIQSDHPVV